MKRVQWVAGIGLMATAAAAAIFARTSSAALGPRQRSLRLVPACRPGAGHLTRRRCVRLGWKAPYWYAGAPNGEASESLKQ
jgi:hypothetical protein